MAEWWLRGKEPLLQNEAEVAAADLATDAVTTVKITDLNVTSEKISANALQRSIVVPLADLGAATTAPFTSDYTVWTPKTAAYVNGAWLTFLTSMVNTTVQTTPVGTLYNGASAALGTVAVPTTNAPVRGTALAFTVTAASVAAGQAITYGMTAATSAGMDFPPLALQIDYTSTA